MRRHLYLICPSDHLEPVINNKFKRKNYFLTSPGNSIIFDSETLAELEDWLLDKGIQEISFVLSDDNQFVSDGLGKKGFSSISGLSGFYDSISSHREQYEGMWQQSDYHFLILSQYLNNKIRELKLGLAYLMTDTPAINGLIYKRNQGEFGDIYSELICKKFFSLN